MRNYVTWFLLVSGELLENSQAGKNQVIIVAIGRKFIKSNWSVEMLG